MERGSRIVIAAPRRPGRSAGNQVTAARWARRLTELDHHSQVATVDQGNDLGPEVVAQLEQADVLIALHAGRTAAVSRWWKAHRPDRPLIVALTGTDLYHDLPDDDAAMSSCLGADRLVVLQSLAIDVLTELHPAFGAKARLISQSVDRDLPVRRPVPDEIRVAVLAHLRAVKDPLLAAIAASQLPPESRVRVHLAGAANDEWRRRAQAEAAANPRFCWQGELDPDGALGLVASAHALVSTSRLEGGPNAITEAIALGVPVLATRVDGNVGLLGRDYPGLFEVGDSAGLARLLRSVETSTSLVAELHGRILELQPVVEPAAERRAWAALLAGLGRLGRSPRSDRPR